MLKTGVASLERLEYILDAEDTVPAPNAPRPLPAGPLPIVFERVGFAYAPDPARPTTPPPGPRCATSTCGPSRARPSRWSARAARVNPPSSPCCPASTIQLRAA